jgi:ABC-type multidrug transport system permease subunit
MLSQKTFKYIGRSMLLKELKLLISLLETIELYIQCFLIFLQLRLFNSNILVYLWQPLSQRVIYIYRVRRLNNYK